MVPRAHPVFLAIFLLVLAPIAAAVVISMLLLFGVEARVVFAPGRAVKSMFEAAGFHVANRVAVASTVGLVWALIAGAGMVWERRRR